jgi:hypothetical protein
MFKKNRVSTNTSAKRTLQKDSLRVLPRSQVSEPTRSPFVVWSSKARLIVSEHKSKQGAISSLRNLKKDVKAGKYD